MNDKDQLFRFIFEQLDIRGELITLEDCWQETLARHDYPENIRQQLGEALAAAAILSATIKFDGSLILQVRGDGPLNTLVAHASSKGELCGLAKWSDVSSATNLADIYGKAQMLITIRHHGSEPYQSIVPLIGTSLGTALEYYFTHSEQLNSRFWLFVSKNKIAGLFLQQLPQQHASEEQRQENWDKAVLLADTINAEELFTLSPEEVLHRLYHDEDIRLYEPKDYYFHCGCSRQKIEGSLMAMGKESLLEIIEDEGKIAVDCEFCHQHYEFAEQDVENLFTESTGLEKDPVLH